MFQDLSPKLKYLDSHKGYIPWFLTTGQCLMRVISYSMDRYGSKNDNRELESDFEIIGDSDVVHFAQSCPFLSYLAYIFYAPLYLTGPMISFDDWIAQVG
jgi:D-alanyl-lipoteichoic acid acyltransferase DltB (MBOAT superfamily)